MIDVIYPVHNRLYYTQMSFPRVLHECELYGNCKLWIYDDNSTDGSSEFIKHLLKNTTVDYQYTRKEIGNSTYCINETIKNGEAEYLYKVDNDILIPTGSFSRMVMYLPKDAGFMMLRESGDYPYLGHEVINKDRSHIGGVGIFRRKAFDSGLIRSDGRFYGFTNYQIQAKKRGWKCAELEGTNTNLDMSPFYSRAKEYQLKGWGRILNKVKSVWHK